MLFKNCKAVLGPPPHPPFPSPRTTIAVWIFYRTFIVGKFNRLLTDVGSYINILCIQKGLKNSWHSFSDLVAGLYFEDRDTSICMVTLRNSPWFLTVSVKNLAKSTVLHRPSKIYTYIKLNIHLSLGIDLQIGTPPPYKNNATVLCG